MIIGGNELHSTLSKVELPVLGHNLWRIDPTGQFWKCHAAAVGKGAGKYFMMQCGFLQFVSSSVLTSSS